jgi:hypothetical protein
MGPKLRVAAYRSPQASYATAWPLWLAAPCRESALNAPRKLEKCSQDRVVGPLDSSFDVRIKRGRAAGVTISRKERSHPMSPTNHKGPGQSAPANPPEGPTPTSRRARPTNVLRGTDTVVEGVRTRLFLAKGTIVVEVGAPHRRADGRYEVPITVWEGR